MTDGATESIGDLPELWKAVRLGDIAKSRGGFGFPVAEQGRKEGEYPFFKVSDMNLLGNEKFMRDSNHWIDTPILKQLKAKTFPRSSIVFPKIGAAIQTNKKRMLVRDSIIDNNIMAVVVNDKSECLPEYLYQWFLTLDLGRIANPGTVPSLTSGRLEEVRLPLPPLPEQRRIAGVLGIVQLAIEQQERLLQLTVELKKTLLCQLFTKGLRGEPQKSTEIGPKPKSWEIVELGGKTPKLLEVMSNGYTGKQTIESQRYKVSRIETIGNGYIDNKRVRYAVSPTDDTIEKYRLLKGDILFSHINSEPHLGKTGIAEEEYEDLLHGMNLLLIRARPAIVDPWFLNYLFQWYRQRGIFIMMCSRAVNQASINQGKLKALRVPLPKIDEQNEIATALRTVDVKSDYYRRKKTLTEALLLTLLHQLMTAKIRVNNLDLPDLES